MKKISITLLGLLIAITSFAQDYSFSDSWGDPGLSINSQSVDKVNLNFSIDKFNISEALINGESMQEIFLPNVFLPNDEGAPNLPGTGRYIALPQGSIVKLEILNFRTETYENIEVAPSPRIPWDTETDPLDYSKDLAIYSKDSFYPENPVKLSEQTLIRGVDAAMLGITPFQYNPVTKELLVYRDIEIELSFEGGNGNFGEDRLRSRWWDPIIRDIFENQASIPAKNYNHNYLETKDVGCEYLIVTPNDAEFQAWADSIKTFRTRQGIMTDIFTLDDIGGNNVNTLETFFNDAYNTWDIVPSAVLLLGDYGTNAANSIVAPIWDNYCASDNIYSDVNNNDMPDMIFARITAQHEAHLEAMITKFLNYERTPPTSEDFYNHPITALGWQTERWFQICSESVGGFLKNELGKEPVRINEVYGGNPEVDPWSTATNTYTVMNVFGPNGLGYIPAAPSELGDWAGGNADDVNTAINNGSFMLQHRDHGYENGWGEPAYSGSSINGLTNTDLTFVFSINCLTGKYNMGSECFTEKFHRYKYNGENSGALGLIAASEVSYSFVNDAFVWGIYDNLWPEFLPQYGSSVDHLGILPAFGNAAGKYFLQQSSWPYNTNSKEVTYNLFHHHGDAFLTVYSEVPQEMVVIHDQNLLEGVGSFSVYANEGAFICLSLNDVIIGTGVAEGGVVDIEIPGQVAGEEILITVTKQNYYRYESTVNVIDSDVAYVVHESTELNDEAGNDNGLMDYGESISLSVTMKNIGMLEASDVEVVLTTENEFITITDDNQVYGNFDPEASVLMTDAFAFDVNSMIPDNENVFFELQATDGLDVWTSSIVFKSHAPMLDIVEYTISDPDGNNNNRIDPGETVQITVTITNNGSSEAFDVMGELACSYPGITINTSAQAYGDLNNGDMSEQTFEVMADGSIEEGVQVDFEIYITGEGGINSSGYFQTVIGQFVALILDLDPINYSGPAIYETFGDMDIYADYTTDFPEDLGLYKNIFVCLGLHFTNYELSEEEGQLLKDYLLNNSGNLYMEGRVTWKDDPQTPVHSMFNIDVENLSMYMISEIVGVPGSITSNMMFAYDGNNPVCDYSINPVAPAYSLFSTQDEEHISMVAYNAGSYRTIASTVEFGKFIDGEAPSTKADLMTLILNWFDGLITNNEEYVFGQGNSETISFVPNPFNYETSVNIFVQNDSEVSLKIFNLQGKEIKTLYKGKLIKGNHNFNWDGLNKENDKVMPGVYFGVMQTNKTVISEKIILSN